MIWPITGDPLSLSTNAKLEATRGEADAGLTASPSPTAPSNADRLRGYRSEGYGVPSGADRRRGYREGYDAPFRDFPRRGYRDEEEPHQEPLAWLWLCWSSRRGCSSAGMTATTF